MFLHNQAAELLRDEIEKALAVLRGIPDYYKQVREPLEKKRRGLAPPGDFDCVWQCLPLIVSHAVCGEYKHVLPAAAAFQFLFAAADVFDDIEDADNPNSVYTKYGLAAAISVATTLLILGEQCLTKLRLKGVNADSIVRVIETVNSFYVTACTGQHMDLATDKHRITEETYLKSMAMKTASQIECSCYVGAFLAGADQELTGVFADFGRNLGMASQITNDIQGIVSGRDIGNGRITLPVLFALNNQDVEVHNKLDAYYYHRIKNDGDSALMKELLFQTGSIHYATVKVELYKQISMDALAAANSAGADVAELKPLLQ